MSAGAETGEGSIPVVEIDGRKIGAGLPGPVTQRLTADFHALVRRSAG
jgi:branched-subunit amino acid aminotransferase/4-amino-4-deoxychorismate lyase